MGEPKLSMTIEVDGDYAPADVAPLDAARWVLDPEEIGSLMWAGAIKVTHAEWVD